MKKQTSLKWKIGWYLIFFSLFIIGMLVLFQLVLLEPMYEKAKADTIRKVGANVAEAYQNDSANAEELIFQESMANDACIFVIGSSEQITSGNPGCILFRMTTNQIAEQIGYAEASDDNTYLSVQQINGERPKDNQKEMKNLIYTIINEGANDTNTVIMVSMTVSPVGATMSTLKMQLWFIGGIIILAVLLLTLLLNRQITKPLTAITEEAKNLPKGQFVADTKNNKYLEAAELNETLSEAAVEIQKADKAKRDLIANVSHDLRTPLTMITGYGEMMLDLPNEKTDENIQVIVDESKRLNNLVNDLLDLSKMQENGIILERSDFDLTGMIDTQMRKYDVYKMRDGYDIRFEPKDSAFVNADRKRMEQVFNNFMTNAINYSGEEKYIEVREDIGMDTVRVSIEDHGEGIEKEKLKDIWDRYYKVDKTHFRVQNGSGIGLSIVREILDLHGFQYGVTSEKGKGSTFWFEVPLKK